METEKREMKCPVIQQINKKYRQVRNGKMLMDPLTFRPHMSQENLLEFDECLLFGPQV